MTRLSWSNVGERTYENGVDQGVLYVGTNPGVAWVGLISVSESPTGGDPRPYYQDGIKYLNLSAAEEYEATLNAFASPKEFGVCDGVVAISNGLFATQQRRKSFGLSYRTRVGNDVAGNAFGYKIHLVYNALASPSERNNQTQSSDVSLTTKTWKISTVPPTVTGFKPTAHYIIDSRFTDAAKLANVENILYGSDAASARLPVVSELITLLS